MGKTQRRPRTPGVEDGSPEPQESETRPVPESEVTPWEHEGVGWGLAFFRANGGTGSLDSGDDWTE